MDAGSSVNFAAGEAERFSVAFFTGIFDLISAAVGHAVGSAGIRGSIIILSSIIALFSNLDNSISANGSGSGVVGWESNTSSGSNHWVSAVEALEVSVGGWWNDVGKRAALGGSQQSWLLDNEPSDVLGAWWSSFGTSIGEGSKSVGRNQEVQVDVPTRQSLTASVKSTDWRASRKSGVGVESTSITLLALVSLSDTITAEGAGTLGGASGGSIDTSVTFFIRVDDTISAEVASAVESASVGEGV